MSKRRFATANGTVTDIMHSYAYNKMPYRQRQDAAFNKDFLETLTERDKYLMRGYAQAKIEELNAFKYKNPNYKRKKNARKGSSYEQLNRAFNVVYKR